MKQLLGHLALACAFSWTVMASQDPAAGKSAPIVRGKKPPSADAPFIGTVAMNDMAEVEHGRLASQNASSPDVKQFAQRMVDDHSRAAGEMKGLAKEREVTLATKLDDEHRATQDRLAKLKGAAFDKAYMEHMVNAHIEAVKLLQQEADAGQDDAVKAWAAKTLPTIQEHLKMASSLNATLGRSGK
jgi:putative membrane protein